MRLAAQRAPHNQQSNQTNLKLPVGHQQTRPAKDKMKFNWRANWEILLVFVIIIVGIVITTIAAIRSKDKHMQVAPDESADYGADPSSSLQVPPLPQTDFQMQHGLAADVPLDGLDETTVPKRPPRSSTPAPQAAHRGDRKRNHQAGDMPKPSANVAEAIVAAQAKSAYQNGRQQSAGPSQSAHSRLPGQIGPPANENYETLSTEQTPSQSMRSNGDDERAPDQPASHQSGPKQSDGRRDPRQHQAHSFKEQPELADYNDQSEAQPDSGAQKTRTGSSHSAMQGPYELTIQQQLQPHSNSATRNALSKSPRHQDPMTTLAPPQVVLDPDGDMMTSYTRAPQNLTDALLKGDYSASPSVSSYVNKNNTLMAASVDDENATSDFSGGQLQGLPAQTLVNSQHNRAYANLPYAMLLGDLIKLSRPQPLIDSQASLEQPANPGRPQFSILQQLRSLPAPLLALFQHTSNGAQNVGDQLQNHHLANHDASESMDHFQRISMSPYSDLNALVARSIRATNPLPAFPPPKGVPLTWVPSNMGGVSVLHEAASSTADFVASETAGFVRGGGGNGASGGLQMAASNVSPQEQMASESSRSSSSQPAPNGASLVPAEETMRQTSSSSPSQQPDQAHLLPANQNHLPSSIGQNSIVAQPAPAGPPVTNEAAQSNVHVPSQTPLVSNYNSAAAQPVQPSYLQYIMQQRPRQRSDTGGLLRTVGNSLIDSSSKLGLQANNVAARSLGGTAAPGQLGQQHKVADMGSRVGLSGAAGKQTIQLNTINRVRRSIDDGDRFDGKTGAIRSASTATRAGQPEDDEETEEEYLDSGPISVVRPDGRPAEGAEVRLMRTQRLMPGGQDRGSMLQASSQRQVNHADLNESALNHYISDGESNKPHTGSDSRTGVSRRRKQSVGQTRSTGDETSAEDSDGPKTDTEEPEGKPDGGKKRAHLSGPAKKKQKLKKKKMTSLQLDAAGSGLMSKLLGVASTTDELEDDLDGDDDESASEKRKEELEDAEFGIANDDRTSGPSSDSSSSNDIGDQDNHDVSRLAQDTPSGNQDTSRLAEMPPIRSAGTTDSNAYARRNQQQQRSDVEFYGHPGEETRQLKYGILGSGNYEVVNGGIYPDIDESTAAVNSVANYVRKPGAVLLSGLTQLVGAGASEAGARPLGGGGFMRGASAASPGSVGMFHPHQPGPFSKMGSASPLLDVLDAAHVSGAGQTGYFDQNLLAHLGSSGTSTRTTQASPDEDPDEGDPNGVEHGNDSAPKRKRKYEHRRLPFSKEHSHGDRTENWPKSARQRSKNELMTTMETLNDANNRIKSSNEAQSTQGRKMNQFYSYHILPSKKVTIFSDQDLDSAPDDQTSYATYVRPDETYLPAQRMKS